ncbi:MAG: DUF1064 domain-containing protein [Chloroflexota bacterium]
MVKADRPPVVDPLEWAAVQAAMKRQNKFNAEAFIDADGRRWHSQDEFERWGDLVTMAWAGKITDLRRQVRYVLQPAFRDNTGRRVRAISYTLDFTYFEDGREIAEDFKGVQTQAGMLRQKLFRAKYPDIELRVTRKDGKR